MKSVLQLNMLERLSPLIVKEETESRCNCGLKSNFSNCPLIYWHVRSGSNATKMEKTQEKALPLVFDDYHLNSPTHIAETLCN